MKFLNQQSTAVFNRLLALNQIKISNSELYMPVCFELIAEYHFGNVYSVAHYFIQNGDMMADPEMTFLKLNNGNILPLSFRQDSLGLYKESVILDDNGPKYCILMLQRDQCYFANQWFQNIKIQQKL